MSKQKKQVCVVGAGASGLVAIKELLDEGHRVTCFEKYDQVGGVFYQSNYREKPGAYDSTKLTISNYMMAFSSFPPREAEERRFWSAVEYQHYLKEFGDRFAVTQTIQFETEVVRVKRERSGGCIVETRTRGNDELTTHRFDAVAISTGTHRVPRMIQVEGMETFPGEVHHSAVYRNAAPYHGKRVLCIGLGETASDVLNEIAEVAGHCALSVRRHQPVVERYPMGKEHTNDAYTSHMLYSVPTRALNRLRQQRPVRGNLQRK